MKLRKYVQLLMDREIRDGLLGLLELLELLALDESNVPVPSSWKVFDLDRRML